MESPCTQNDLLKSDPTIGGYIAYINYLLYKMDMYIILFVCRAPTTRTRLRAPVHTGY